MSKINTTRPKHFLNLVQLCTGALLLTEKLAFTVNTTSLNILKFICEVILLFANDGKNYLDTPNTLLR